MTSRPFGDNFQAPDPPFTAPIRTRLFPPPLGGPVGKLGRIGLALWRSFLRLLRRHYTSSIG
jgi:hypothetical protein